MGGIAHLYIYPDVRMNQHITQNIITLKSSFRGQPGALNPGKVVDQITKRKTK